MIDFPWSGRIAAAALLTGLLLAGCGTGGPPVGAGPASPPADPTVQQTAQQSTRETTRESPQPSAGLPWPAAGAADAAALQAAADRGAQPWLLDPSEVAMSYVAAAHGWTDAEAVPRTDGTSVDVRRPDGERLALTLAQPGRTGAGGIWVVTRENDG
ncbi:hypothetical protein ACQPWY_10180 [Pseudonocardia xinjiangensis]|uniref:hypothetical protein n=1 Tax=Pseudonocardia xinjiangensis TaxID=75289 RepID=UPI003D910D8C